MAQILSVSAVINRELFLVIPSFHFSSSPSIRFETSPNSAAPSMASDLPPLFSAALSHSQHYINASVLLHRFATAALSAESSSAAAFSAAPLKPSAVAARLFPLLLASSCYRPPPSSRPPNACSADLRAAFSASALFAAVADR